VISLKALTSASSASAYYAADNNNYYTMEEARDLSAWAGRCAEALGLSGPVDEQVFATMLDGKSPNGSAITAQNGRHKPGIDLTFSASKSVSLVALLGKDERLVEAMRQSVLATLAWAQDNVMEARVWDPVLGKQVPEKTGNLAAAIGNLHRARRGGIGMGRRIDDDGACALCPCGLDLGGDARRGAVDHLGRQALTPGRPLAGGGLRVGIDDQRGKTGLFGGGGKVDSKRGLSGPAFLADNGDGVHVGFLTWAHVHTRTCGVGCSND
jgi:hypothetical protein